MLGERDRLLGSGRKPNIRESDSHRVHEFPSRIELLPSAERQGSVARLDAKSLNPRKAEMPAFRPHFSSHVLSTCSRRFVLIPSRNTGKATSLLFQSLATHDQGRTLPQPRAAQSHQDGRDPTEKGKLKMAFAQTNRRLVSTLIAAIAATVSLSGCATVAGGGRDQCVHIDSEPQGAQVRVDGQLRGVTPIDVELSRRQEHQVQLDLEGRPPYVTTLKPGCNPWVFGNLLVGGLVGLAVDASTGAVSTLYPKEVKAAFGHPQTPNTFPPLNTTVGNGAAPSGSQPASYRSPAGPQPVP